MSFFSKIFRKPKRQPQQQQDNCSFESGSLEDNTSSPQALVPIARVAQLIDDDETKPLAAVIVTIFEGYSYDALFRVKPQIIDGGRVS